MKYFNQEIDEALIELIRSNRLLYDASDIYYKNKHRKDDTWGKISEDLKIPVADIKNRWKHFRDHYTKKIKAGNPGRGKVRWEYMSKLTFLSEVPPLKNTIINLELSKIIENQENVHKTCDNVHQNKNLFQNNVSNNPYLSGENNLQYIEQYGTQNEHKTCENVHQSENLFQNNLSNNPYVSGVNNLQYIEQYGTQNEHKTCENVPKSEIVPKSENLFQNNVLNYSYVPEVNTSQYIEPSGTIPPTKKLRKSDGNSNEKRQEKNADVSKTLTDQETSSIHRFFDSMADIVSQFPPHLAAEARLKVCQVVNQIEMKTLTL